MISRASPQDDCAQADHFSSVHVQNKMYDVIENTEVFVHIQAPHWAKDFVIIEKKNSVLTNIG